MKDNFFIQFKNTIPFPFSYFENMFYIVKEASIENNFKNKWIILFTFFISISVSGDFANLILDLKFNFANSINNIELFRTYIYNAVPLAIIYSLSMYIVVFRQNINIRYWKNFFLQIIIFFTVGNVVIAINMLIAIDQLMIHNINMFKDNMNTDSIQNLIVIIIVGLVCLWSIYRLLFKPTYLYLSKFYKRYKILSFLIILSTFFINNIFYNFSFYPKIDTKDLIITEKFCKEILDIKIIYNDQCSKVNNEENNLFKQKCINLINNS